MAKTKPKISIATFRRWANSVPDFVDEVLRNPSNGEHYTLYPNQRTFLDHVFERDPVSKKPIAQEICLNLVKKAGKSETQSWLALNILFAQICGATGPRESGTIYVLSSAVEQSQSIIFSRICALITASDILRPLCEITDWKVKVPSLDSEIVCMPNAWRSGGGRSDIVATLCDEVRSWSSEGLAAYEEMTPLSSRHFSVRIVSSHRGVSGQEKIIEDLVERAEGPESYEIAPELRRAPGLLAWISHSGEQVPWLDQAWRDLVIRSNRVSTARQYLQNLPSSAEDAFIDEETYDRCVDDNALPSLGGEAIVIGIDCAVKRDAACCVAVSVDRKANIVRLIDYKCVYPNPNRPVDVENDIENYVLTLAQRHKVNLVLADPFQFYNSIQRLSKRLKIEAFNQTVSNLNKASQNLYSLFRGGNLRLFPSPELKEHAMNTVMFESKTGSFRIGKHARKGVYIDLMAALSFACIGAIDLAGLGDWGVQAAPWAADDSMDSRRPAEPAQKMSGAFKDKKSRNRVPLTEQELLTGIPIYRKDVWGTELSEEEKCYYLTGGEEGSQNPYEGEESAGFVMCDEADVEKLRLWRSRSQSELSR